MILGIMLRTVSMSRVSHPINNKQGLYIPVQRAIPPATDYYSWCARECPIKSLAEANRNKLLALSEEKAEYLSACWENK